MKALVLGGTGPTGPNVVNGLLERGYNVTIMHSGLHEVEFSQPVEHIHGDVHFEETLLECLGRRTFDLVVFMYGRLKTAADVMVGRTGRMVSVGGGLAGQCHPSYYPFGRLLPVDPNSPMEQFLSLIRVAEQGVMDHHRAGHYSATHIRYPFLYGPRQPGSFEWSIVRRILDGRRELIIGADLKLESRCYVDNAAHAVLLAVDRPEVSGGKIYDVSDERVLTMRERVEVIAEALGHKWDLIELPYAQARPFHPYAQGCEHRAVDVGSIKTELGYRDVVPIEEALRATARWLAANPPKPGGELERQLGDPFDYAAEDAMIAAYRSFERAIVAVPFKDYMYKHPYRHPKRPNEVGVA